MCVCVCVLGAHSLEKLNEQPGVALHHVGLQVGQRDQLIEELDEENVVLFAEPSSVQLQKTEGERETFSSSLVCLTNIPQNTVSKLYSISRVVK